MVNAVPKLIEPWFLFSLVWSVGATCDGDSREKFDQFLRKKMDEEKVKLHFIFSHCIISE